MLLVAPSGGVVDASEEHSKALLSAGWTPAEPQKKPRKRTTRKAAPKKTE